MHHAQRPHFRDTNHQNQASRLSPDQQSPLESGMIMLLAGIVGWLV